ncbi:MAG TPA: flagellar motor switch protein FliM [bacterium]|nr:flagellar motor switch protein FliM [bacterium]HOL46973.1 flagellar motor switch protein FliM [bacterium]HPQ18238.1 flagellar motor switch protein FliM [bacterium]
MTEILSQEEIDSLLSAISSGATEAPSPAVSISEGPAISGGGAAPLTKKKGPQRQRKVKLYDFKRPDKFSKDQIRTLQMIHEVFARLTTAALSAQLRTIAHLHVASVDQLTYEEFMKSIPNPTTLTVIDMHPLEGSCVIEIDPAIAFTMIDRLFGGKGAVIQISREMTDIEQSVIEKIMIKILNNLKEAWINVVDLKPRLEKIESNPQFVQIVPPNDMVVLITLETKVGEVEGMTNLCIPYIVIEPIINKLSAQFWYASIRRGSTTESLKRLEKKLNDIDFTIAGELGDTYISVEDLLKLKVGDVIKLNQEHNELLKLLIDNFPKFLVKVGIANNRYSLEVVDEIDVVKELKGVSISAKKTEQ